jgi:hypothetical protein
MDELHIILKMCIQKSQKLMYISKQLRWHDFILEQ